MDAKELDAIQCAVEYVGTLDNASGQMCQMKDGKPHLLLFDFGCPNCSEVESRNADDWGDAIELLVNSVPKLLAELGYIRIGNPTFTCEGCGRDTHIRMNGLCLACAHSEH